MGSTVRLKPGDTFLDRYKVVRELGRGYTGIVWEVYNPFTRRSYALKLMHEPSEHQVSRLSAEASLLIQIDHKHVVKVHDAGQLPDGRGWLLMDLLRGQTLAELLAKQGALTPLQAIHYVLGIAWGVDAAHEQGVIHRDLKPANVFIVEGENLAKVLDFSGAKYMNTDLRTTKPPDMTGTLAYMSPQQIDGEAADGRMDVYSLGLMLYEMLTGKSPFAKYFNNIHRLAVAQAAEMPPLIAAKLGLPACFDEVIQRATAKEAEDRYPTPAAFAQAVLECKRQLLAEVAAGVRKLEKRPGEPSLHDTDSRQEYQAPQAVVRPDTAPVEPVERITITPPASVERSVPSAPPEAEPGAAHGPTGTVRLSEIHGLLEEGRRAAASWANRPTLPSQVPTERVRRAPQESPATAAVLPNPSLRAPAKSHGDESTDPLPTGAAVSQPPAATKTKPFPDGDILSRPPVHETAGSGGPARSRSKLARVLGAALVLSVAGSVAIVGILRPVRLLAPGALTAAAPSAATLVPDPPPSAAPSAAGPADPPPVPELPPSAMPVSSGTAAPSAAMMPPPRQHAVAPVTMAPAPKPPAPSSSAFMRQPKEPERKPPEPFFDRPIPTTPTLPATPAAPPTAAPSAAPHRLFGAEN